jgi:hypothetical protein
MNEIKLFRIDMRVTNTAVGHAFFRTEYIFANNEKQAVGCMIDDNDLFDSFSYKLISCEEIEIVPGMGFNDDIGGFNYYEV